MNGEQRIARIIRSLQHGLHLERLKPAGDFICLGLERALQGEIDVGFGFQQLVELSALIHPLAQRVVRRARSESAHNDPSAILCSSSARRAAFPSTSKKAPELGEATIETGKTISESHENSVFPPARISLRASVQYGVLCAISRPTCSTYSCQLLSISSLKSWGSVPSRMPCCRFSG